MHKKKNTILVIDSQPQTKKMLDLALNEMEFKVVDCVNGKQATALSVSIKPDLVLVDLDLPDMEGKDVIASLREWSQMPIITLSSRNRNEDEISALETGADDYVQKPFNMDVLLARINANLRKSAVRSSGEPEVVNGPLRMDLVKHQVYIHNQLVYFTPKEYDLLKYLLQHRAKMLTHKAILKDVWGIAHDDDTQYLRVFIGQLRKKIEADPVIPKMIITEPGIGYRMDSLPPMENTGKQGELRFNT